MQIIYELWAGTTMNPHFTVVRLSGCSYVSQTLKASGTAPLSLEIPSGFRYDFMRNRH